MSNNLTRKALAFGSMVALGASALVGLPAQADANGPITLLPNGGTRDGATFTSLIGAGITLDAALASSLQEESDTQTSTGTTTSGDTQSVTVTTTIPAVDPLAEAWYIIENPSAADLFIGIDSEDQAYYIYDGDGDAGGVNGSEDGDFELGLRGGHDFGYLDNAYGGAADMQDGLYVDVGEDWYVTNATKIAISAADEWDDTPGARRIAPIYIDAVDQDGDDEIELEVTVLADTNDETIGGHDYGEYKSAAETVTLVNSTSVSTVTRMDAVETTRDEDDLVASVTIGGGVNPYAVYDSYTVAVLFFQDGVPMYLSEDDANIDVATNMEDEVTYVDGEDWDAIEEDGLVAWDYTEDGELLESAVYSARAVFLATDPDQLLGARSQVLDLRDGTNADVDDIYASVTETDNLMTDEDDSYVRTGTKNVSATLQITDAGEDLANAGVRVRVTVSASLDADSTVTVGGTSLADGDSTTYYAYTNSLGQVPVALSNSGAADGDVVTLSYATLLNDGLYESGSNHTFTWADAVYATFVTSPSELLQGDTVNVTFTAVDQYGVGLDSNEDGRFSFKVEALVDGVIDESVYSETEPTTNGSASFSFANFADEGTDQEVIVYLYAGTTQTAQRYLSVFNNLATSDIAISDEFETDVMYSDTVEGDADLDSALAALAHATVDGDNYVTIVGTVLDENNAGQPGAAVVVSAAGVQFWDGPTNVYAVGSITVYANEQGYFELDAQTQTANASGQTVTITSGGVTETTLLKSYLPADLDVDNLKLSWTLPANIVKDTTYSVVTTLTDVWGNPVRTKAPTADDSTVLFTAEGALQVNGVSSVGKEFSSTGTVTVFLRSVADIAGPGSFTAALVAGEDAIDYYTGDSTTTSSTDNDAADTFQDDVNTSWDESAFAGALTTTVDVLETAPAVATGVVNVGSFNGKLVVYAKGLAGQKISWKVAGKWGVAYPTTSFERFDRPTGAVGVNVIVEIYVNGVKQLTKTVLTR